MLCRVDELQYRQHTSDMSISSHWSEGSRHHHGISGHSLIGSLSDQTYSATSNMEVQSVLLIGLIFSGQSQRNSTV